MYMPRQFEVTDRAWAVELIERHPFGLLVTCDAAYPRVSHLPFVCEGRGESLQLVGHVARGDPHVRSILAESRATVVFGGPHAYVSASWYEQPYATVPTWNYTAVQVLGTLRRCDAWHAVRILSKKMEGTGPDAWDPEKLDVTFRESQLRGIVAFELRADAVYAKAKLSQNRTEADRDRVAARLAASPDQTERETAEAMTLVQNG
jgi:transcriptional regulator